MSTPRSLPPLNALRAFEATARLGSVTAAAEELSVTHGAVSRQIRALEAHFATTLFDRAGRGLVLTRHGRRLHAGVGDAFTALSESCHGLAAEIEGAPFTLACPGSLLARWLIPRLDRLQRALPELRLNVFASEGGLDPGRDDVSASLAFISPPWPAGMRVIELAEETIGAVATPTITAPLEGRPPAALFDATLLDTTSRPQAWPQWAAAMGLDDEQLARARREGQSFEHLYYLLEAALAGLGMAIAPRLVIAGELASGRLIAPWGFVDTGARLCLQMPRESAERGGEQLAQWLREELATS
ncbi:LysR family transcriptional regulator [Kushneria aurantia]|uniref:LysR family transcriptional regulator n=1 Tax=Kushneria aurantia TaxID=504092 RepID=A0ABV6G0I5_9GAMM|nr:LysR family transcriptional regulator [Kushneria aurantia]